MRNKKGGYVKKTRFLTGKKDWKIILGLAVCLVLSVFSFAMLQWKGASTRQPMILTTRSLVAPQSTNNSIATWSEIPFDPAPYGAVPDNLPVMHRFHLYEETIDGDKVPLAENKVMKKRFAQLIEQNVVLAVARELMPLIKTRKIIPQFFTGDLETRATFFVKDGHAYLEFNADRIAEINSPIEVVIEMSAIAHEFDHYKQWKRATDFVEKDTFVLGYVFRFRPEACVFVWRHENEAYTNQCWVLNGAGILWKSTPDPKEDFCKMVYSRKAFNQAFYFSMMKTSTGNVRTDCKQIWWNIVLDTLP